MLSFGLVLVALFGCTFGKDLGITCPSEGQHFYPHPTRCAKFIECNEGVIREHECFGDLTFNPLVSYCDFPENYPCEDKPENGPVGICPPVNNILNYFLTDSGSCEMFYMCNWGEPIPMLCPDGLHFNPTRWVCDWPDQASCTAGK